MYQRFWKGIVAAVVLVAASAAFAAGELAPDKAPPNGAARHRLAQEWSLIFSALDAQIPNLSPSQQAWLKREYDDRLAAAGNRYTPRVLSATNSLEYQLRVAKPHASELKKALGVLASSPPSALDEQVALWALVAYSLMDKTFWQSVENLIERDLVDRQIGHVSDLYYENYVLQAQGIVANIVIPYLQGSLPK